MSRFFSKNYASLVPYTPGEQPQNRKYLKLNTNESPFPPSPLAQKLAREAAGEAELYSDPEVKALREAFAQKYPVSEDEVVFVNGSDEILNFCMMAFCDDEHTLAYPDITYSFYDVVADLNHIPVQKFPLRDDFTVNVEDYIGIRKNIFIANPNAPTGIALPKSEIERIVASNPDNIVVVDEAYVDFGAESSLDLIHKYDNVIVCQTFSKSRSLAGARLGFGAGNKELIKDINTIRFSTNPYNINRMTMWAGIGALTDTDYFKENCAKIQATRAWTAKKLKELGFVMTESKANFLFAKHPSIGGQELYLTLKEKGVLVRHFETPLLKDYNRITIGSDEQMEEFIETIKEILEEKK